jgi:four helix bundle protein
MFDFEKLEVYQKAKVFNSQIIKFITDNKQLEKAYSDQLRRASFSIMLNIAEGTGRFSNADRCNFFIIARSSPTNTIHYGMINLSLTEQG